MRQWKTGICSTMIVLVGLCAMGSRYQPVSLDKVAPTTVQAEIKGEVEKPGIYTLKYGQTIQDLIQAAGGETEQADLSSLSLLEEVEEGRVVVIGALENGESSLISINTATEEELQQLPGIGEAIARRIIEYRQQTPFQKLEDLMEVKGIGEKTFEKMRDRLAL